jgi:C-terminal processing protease CtpA/Prc
MKRLSYILIFFLLLAVSCEKKPEPEPVKEVTPAMARDTLYYIMKQWYYWYDKMPSVTKENYADPYELLKAMKYTPLDKWSNVQDYDAFTAKEQGSFVGHGFRIGLDNTLKARIVTIYKNSQLYSSGVRRGWIVKKINNVEVAPLLMNSLTSYNELIGPATAGIPNTFLFEKPDGSELTVTATKTELTINAVLHYDTLHLKSGITGHLVYEQFISPSEQELITAFSYFKANGVKNIILDLRYNLGGLVPVAQSLASYIAGNEKAGTVFVKLQHNNKNQNQDLPFNFKTTNYSIGSQKVAIITSYNTASASELIINGLKPFTSIVTIGDTTRGKPMGMYSWSCAKKYVFLPITFKTVNSLNEGEFYDGFPPDKLAGDDITHDFKDRKEACLKEAISWLETGVFTGKGSEDFRKPVQVSERPGLEGSIVSEKK